MPPIEPYHEERPWGEFVQFIKNTPATVKIITVKAGEAFSLQHHNNRSEFWRVIGGTGKITKGDEATETKTGDEHFINKGTNHRLEGGPDGISILEIALGDFDENDIVRLEDRYGRHSPK